LALRHEFYLSLFPKIEAKIEEMMFFEVYLPHFGKEI
jgi:hypothetical protein